MTHGRNIRVPTRDSTPRDHAIRMAATWPPMLARGRDMRLMRPRGARAGEVYVSGEAAGLTRADAEAALVWLSSRGIVRELVETETRERPQRYQIAVTLDRLAAFVARESVQVRFNACEHARKRRAQGAMS